MAAAQSTEPMKDLRTFALRMGDNCLILAQNISAWCGHAPILEEDIAMANTSLDLIGQTKLWLGLAANLEGAGASADDLAFKRNAREFYNCLLVEQASSDYGHTLMRQFLFDAWHRPMLGMLSQSSNANIAEIAAKSEKEVAYHLERSTDLIVRLGDGSEESNQRMQEALNDLWCFTGELFSYDGVEEALHEAGVISSLDYTKETFDAYTEKAFEVAMISPPSDAFMHSGGKTGIHSEKFGYLLAEMQFLQRTYPDAVW